ncbi:MAG: toxin-antitoxin system TumE family protein [Rhizobiaceae bacterium]
MKAELLLRRRIVISENAFVEMVAWRVPEALAGSKHAFKYRFAYVVNEKCVLRYDNERGKGDHRHIDDEENAYTFESVDKLIEDFLSDVEGYRP